MSTHQEQAERFVEGLEIEECREWLAAIDPRAGELSRAVCQALHDRLSRRPPVTADASEIRLEITVAGVRLLELGLEDLRRLEGWDTHLPEPVLAELGLLLARIHSPRLEAPYELARWITPRDAAGIGLDGRYLLDDDPGAPLE